MQSSLLLSGALQDARTCRQEEQQKRETDTKAQHSERRWATLQDNLTYVLLLTLSPPIVTCGLASQHPTTAYWVGNVGFYVSLGSLAWVLVGHQILMSRQTICFGVRQRHEQMARNLMMLLFAPTVALMLVAWYHRVVSLDVLTQHSVEDCRPFPAKWRLELAWQEATGLFDRCVSQQVNTTGSRWEDVERATVVQRCSGYEKGRRTWSRDWDYLQALEESQNCHGWCEVGQALWQSTPPDLGKGSMMPVDRCSFVVARLMEGKVFRASDQVFYYCLFVVVLLCALLAAVQL